MPNPAEIFSSSLLMPAFMTMNIRKINTALHFNFYPLCALNKLIEVISTVEPHQHIIRWIIGKDGHLWFGREGFAGETSRHMVTC